MKQQRDKISRKIKTDNDELVYIELDLKCCCPQSTLNNNASIQFSRRYLQCQSSMPVAILRSYIQHILPHSSMTQVTFYDSQHRLLHDQQLLSSLQPSIASPSSSSPSSSPTSYQHIPVRFSLFNTITSLTHCSCSSSPMQPQLHSTTTMTTTSSLPTIIKRETIDQTLSTCASLQPTSTSPIIYSPCLSSSSSPPTQSPSASASTSISIVNLLTPPSSCHSSIDSANTITDRSIIDEITSQFGEICPPLGKKNRNRVSKKTMISSNTPLDLSLKKRSSSSFEMFSSQPKWIKI
ncbi:hypothetical protein I4U23_010280 [Adineta vaga]|nr:hypothetical protein I4U23_010280 [Adineta vaga]